MYFKKLPIQDNIYVDASLKDLWGVWGSQVYSTLVPIDVIGEMSITQYELYNILLAIRLWAFDLTNKVVCVHCDNESAVTVANTGKTRGPFLDLCIRHLAMLCVRFNIDVMVRHIKGVDNIIGNAGQI